jgi:hypothetical protein
MILSTRLTTIGMVCGLGLMLAACGSKSSGSSGSPPALAINLSTPGLTSTVEIGDANPWVSYVYFTGATTQGVDTGGNPDNLQTLTMDTTGATGKVTLVPLLPVTNPSTSVTTPGITPGIYTVAIGAQNAYGSASQAVIFNVLPAGQFTGHPTVVPFDMHHTTNYSQTITLGVRNGIIDQATQAVSLATLPGATGVTVGSGAADLTGGITVTQVGASDSSTITANISINTATLSTSAVTDSSGTAYSNGVLLKLTSLPEATNGYTPIPYVEWFYITPTDL